MIAKKISILIQFRVSLYFLNVKMPHCWKSHVLAYIAPGVLVINRMSQVVRKPVYVIIGLQHSKTCLQGFRQSEIQTSLLSNRD